MTDLEQQWGAPIRTGAKTVSEAFVEKLRDLTDRNHHTDALVTIAKEIGDRKLIDVLESLAKLNDFFGHASLTRDAGYKLYDILMARAKGKLSPESFAAVHGAL